MSLADKLAEQPTAAEVAYTPRTEFDGSSGFIQTGAVDDGFNPKNHSDILQRFGFDPEQVRIVGDPRVSRWEQRARIRGTNTYETTWLSAYRFHIQAVGRETTADLESLIRKARARKAVEVSGPHWAVVQISDTQIGKRSRDGDTEQIVDRYVESIDNAKQELKHLRRHGLAGIQLSYPGDCIEGSVSQSGRNLGFLTHIDVPTQVRIFRRLMLYAVDQLAPLTPELLVDVVNGNHDTAQRSLNSWPGDGWATEAATAVSDALTLNPAAYGHVTIRTPDKWSGAMTVPVGDSVVTVVHGHQWRRGGAFKWWSEQAIGNHPAAGAHVLQHGHWHEWRLESNADRTVVGSSTLDCGSDWYRETHGGTSRRGALIYLLRAGEISRMSVV